MSMTFKWTYAIANKEKDACIVYMDLNTRASGKTLLMRYEVIILKKKFIKWTWIRYSLMFFDNWTLDIIYTLDYMDINVIDYHSIPMNNCFYVNQKLAHKFLNLGMKAYFPYIALGDPAGLNSTSISSISDRDIQILQGSISVTRRFLCLFCI